MERPTPLEGTVPGINIYTFWAAAEPLLFCIQQGAQLVLVVRIYFVNLL